ncbi:lysylphosphatidylglycerol synthase transmembrane domain-containing protein [Niabella beijingensis]|uniref:lysylphosphatidylglycerol synthase transmembrane domain-containing protein n=1 Tax=Niabella beijingensis TaxID=2872700 RepID=UPI001CBEE72A|nr:lysylphosphatidylglycerol synthase transmembrane domain-containing protein [Niabella beijingensis]MBZ4191643.1 flippase-like domain-containing protein [Niabella beijingensis]
MDEKPENKKLFSIGNLIFYGLAILISLFAVYYFGEIKTDFELFQTINPYWLLLAVLGQIGTYFFGAMVYQQLLLGFDIHIHQTVWRLFKISFITLFFNQTIPSAGISGNTFLFNYLQKSKIAVSNIISLISVELLSFYASIEIIIILVVMLSMLFLNIPGSLYIIFGTGFIVYFLFGLSVNVLSNKYTIDALQKKLASIKLFTKLADKFQTFFTTKEQVERPTQFFHEHKTAVYRAVGLQFLIFLSDAFTILALFHGFGLAINLLTVSAGFLLTRIISLLPISPGGLILYESGMTYFFSRLGVHLSSALIITILYRALSFWLPMIVGFFVYRKMRSE